MLIGFNKSKWIFKYIDGFIIIIIINIYYCLFISLYFLYFIILHLF
jgi:hypothetical protein